MSKPPNPTRSSPFSLPQLTVDGPPTACLFAFLPSAPAHLQDLLICHNHLPFFGKFTTNSERVRVAIILRPKNAEDLLQDSDFVDYVELQPELKRLKLRKNNWSSESYRFDEVFTNTASQRRVYEAVTKPVVESVLNGYNGTVMAYGQIGTGKTYTLSRLGKDDTSERGIMAELWRTYFLVHLLVLIVWKFHTCRQKGSSGSMQEIVKRRLFGMAREKTIFHEFFGKKQWLEQSQLMSMEHVRGLLHGKIGSVNHAKVSVTQF
ncbi:uncharacterized protein LOC133823754 [Humulus lupulus]|uniref:uncharacterized protein LOC133823754 n=1 Tax=Humulus lupulus TaxID=3486 RepID=UPI002B402DAE|nr:uncharacterized protein LOC133823754 [Humulus lupulus]